MSQPGWYRDPADPAHLRRWDGQGWTHDVRPAGGVPVGGVPVGGVPAGGLPGRAPSRRSAPPLWVWLLIGALLLGLVAFPAIRSLGGPRGVGGPVDSSTPTVSGWDEGMPSPSHTDTPDPASPQPVNCEPAEAQGVGAGTERVSVGPLSMPRPAPDWAGPLSDPRMPLGRDGYGYRFVLPDEVSWQSTIFIGIVEDPGFTSTAITTRTMSQCILTSGFYLTVDVTMDAYTEQPITIDGVSGTEADFLVRFDSPDLHTKGSALRVIVLDSSPERTWFFSAVPMERADHIAAVDAATAGLQVTG